MTKKTDVELNRFRELHKRQRESGRNPVDCVAETAFEYRGAHYRKGDAVPVQSREDMLRLMDDRKIAVLAIRSS